MSAIDEISDDLPLSADDLRRWQEQRDRIAAHIKALEHRRENLDKLIRAGSALVTSERRRSQQQHKPPPTRAVTTTTEPEAKTAQPSKRPKDLTWTAVIERVVVSASRGMTHEELRADMLGTPLGDRLKETDKAFYGGIAKLVNSHRLVRHNGRIYTPEVFNRFKIDVSLGRASDDPPPPKANHRSPMTEAVKAYLHRHPTGAKSTEIVAELKKNSEFARSINRNKTHIFNILARLIDRKELTRTDGIYRIAQPRLPDQSVRGVSEGDRDAEPSANGLGHGVGSTVAH